MFMCRSFIVYFASFIICFAFNLQERLKQVRNELKKAQSKDIEKKFKEKYYELYVTKAIDKDIKEYGVALEKCLMEFHREKMEHINLIIRYLMLFSTLSLQYKVYFSTRRH